MRINIMCSLVFILLIALAGASMPECACPVSPSSSSLPTVFVDPDTIISDYTLQPIGSSLAVNINVSEATDLFAWQVNMTWNSNVLNWTGGSKGDFLSGDPSEDWLGAPYAHDIDPFTVSTKDPMNTLPPPIPAPNWTTPQRAYLEDNQYAYTNIDRRIQNYYSYQTFSGITTVFKLEVGVEAFQSPYNPADGPERIYLQTSNDNGATWGPIHSITVYGFEVLWWEDCTFDFAWTTAMLANLRTRVIYVQFGMQAATIYLDWLPVRVTDQPVVENPARAWDTNMDSYAKFTYGQRTAANFTVEDFGHNFPGGGTSSYEEVSEIAQVDFYMKFAANASALGDRYRIVYTAPVASSTKVVLKDWTSFATPLGTYSWLNQSDPNDDFDPPGWGWDAVSALRFTVEVEKNGGDVNAQFYEYEAWVNVKYKRPTFAPYNVDRVNGWVLYGESTRGAYTGVSGSGWLGTFTFEVVGYGCSVLNISNPQTKLLDDRTPPNLIPRATSDGYFRNGLTGDANLDKTVNVFDILAVKSRWGRTPASPDWIREYDVNDDSAINVFDVLTVKANWGRTAP